MYRPASSSSADKAAREGRKIERAVVELTDGRWVAFEITLGQTGVDHGAASLLRFRDVVDVERRGKPAVLGVIAATGYGYVRDDGIAVIPIGTLSA